MKMLTHSTNLRTERSQPGKPGLQSIVMAVSSPSTTWKGNCTYFTRLWGGGWGNRIRGEMEVTVR